MNQGRLNRAAFALVAFFAVSANAKDFPARLGEYVVQLKSKAAIVSHSSIERSLGVKVKDIVSKEHGILLVERPLVETAPSAIAALSANSMVRIAEPNYIYRVVGGSSSLPNDAELTRLWGLINSGQVVEGDGGTFTAKAGVDIGAERAWEIETGLHDVIVAVIDTGVNWSHPDLAGNMFTNEAEKNGLPGVDDDANGCVDDVHGCDIVGKDGDPMDVYGHGTHVSGTLGAMGNNANGITGVAWNVRILPVRFLGDDGGGSLADAIKAVDYATAMKANIMNNSWGGGGFSQQLMDAIARARDAGILFLAAAGNSSNDNDRNPEYLASYRLDNVMAVAALDPVGMLADFSNYGKSSVAIAAPGVNIVSYTMRGVESWSGTSMACPHVTGVAALLLSQDTTQTYSTIMARLKNSARPMANLRNRVSTGMVDAYLALTNQVAPADPDDPFHWMKTTENASTLHPFGDNRTETFTFSVPGATRIAVYFTRFDTEAGYDIAEFRNSAGVVVGRLSGNIGEGFGPVVDGDTVTVTITSDDSVPSFGFDVGGGAYQ
ncbi:MAG TPA: S8 family serine peptidase [Bdellovibrionales bacterium]|nr:S8 family serine peptidase [Bdellovibrionales bacterium]